MLRFTRIVTLLAVLAAGGRSSVAAAAAVGEQIQDRDLRALDRCCQAPDPALSLAEELPDLGIPPDLLAQPRSFDPDAPDPLPVFARLLRISEATDATGRKAALLLAADRVAVHVAWSYTVDPRPRLSAVDAGRLDSLRSEGIRVSWNPLAGAWDYDHALLRRLWREHPDTKWGEFAFLHLLERGWWTEVGCPDTDEQSLFREVIVRGEAFLDERPESRHRGLVSFWLAQAYETWWSLSRAEDDQYVTNPDAYAMGSEAARRASMMLYRVVMAKASDVALAAYAEQRLQRLGRRADTEQRRFYCIYD